MPELNLRGAGSNSCSAGARAKTRYFSFEPLEHRRMLSVLPQDVQETTGSSSVVGLTPIQIRTAYRLNSITLGSVVGTGDGQTIAIVDPYDDPALVSSSDSNFVNSYLHKFDLRFGLSDPPSFQKLDQNGGTSYPQTG